MTRIHWWSALFVMTALAATLQAQRPRGGARPEAALTPLPPADARTTKLKELVAAEIKSQPMYEDFHERSAQAAEVHTVSSRR